MVHIFSRSLILTFWTPLYTALPDLLTINLTSLRGWMWSQIACQFGWCDKVSVSLTAVHIM